MVCSSLHLVKADCNAVHGGASRGRPVAHPGGGLERNAAQGRVSRDNDPYTLAIYLLFSTETDPESAEQAAEAAKQKIKNAFREKCSSKETGTWHDIQLIACEVISDQAMTVQQAENLKRWSADHISLRTETPQAMLRDE